MYPEKFENEKDFAQFVKNLGGNLYLVGGAVRDIQMNKEPKDFDYAIEGLGNHILPFKKVGDFFPVYLVEIGGKKCEVALCRTEKKTGKGHTGFEVDVKNVTIKEDLARRDFTINAMAIHVLTGRLIDPFNGREDIRYNILSHVTDAFSEDPLRILRAARFSARFNMNIDYKTFKAMEMNAHKLQEISGERIALELKKTFEQSKDPAVFFRVLKAAQVLPYTFPEIAALDVPDKHDGTTFEHVMNLLRLRS